MARGNGSRLVDPVEMVMEDQRLKGAVDLEAVLEELGGLADSSVKVLLSKIEAGKSQAIDTLIPPLDMDQLVRDLREEYGPGDYWLKFMVDNKFRTSKMFSIAAPRSASIKPQASFGGGGNDMFMMMMKMSEDNRRDQQTLMTTLMSESQKSADRNIQLMLGLIPALVGGKAADPAAMIASLASTMKSMQPEVSPAVAGPNMNELLETLLKLKELAGDGGGEDTSILGLAGKLLPAMIDAARANGANAAPPTQTFALPPPAALAGNPVPANNAFPDTPGHRILSLIAPDLAYCLQRGHAPDFAADLIYGVLLTAGVTLNDLAPLTAELSQAGDNWPAELAAHGVQLADESQLDWFNAVAAGVFGLFSEDSQPPEPAGRPARGNKNPAGNGAARPPRVA